MADYLSDAEVFGADSGYLTDDEVFGVGAPEEPKQGLGSRLMGELGQLKDEFFTGVENTFAGVKTLNAGMQANRLQATERQLAELEAKGRGDSNDARLLRGEVQSLRERLPITFGEAAEAQAGAQRGAQMTTRPEVQRLNESKTWGDAWDAFTAAPYDVIAGVTATSLPTSLPGLVAAAAMGPGAGALGLGLSSAAVEGGSSLGEFARSRGVDTADAKALQAFFSDRQNLADAMTYAGKRAGIIGALDAASGGVAGKTLAPAIKSKIGRQAVNMPAQMAVQAGLGAAGEAGGQLATKGRIDEPGSVLAEAVGEFGGAPAEVLAFSRDARQAMRRDPVQDIMDAPDVDSAIEAAAANVLALPAPGAVAPGETILTDSEGRAGTAADFDSLRRQRPVSEAGAFGMGRGSDIVDVEEVRPPSNAAVPGMLEGSADPLAQLVADRRVRTEAADAVAAQAAAQREAELAAIPEIAAEQNAVQAALERAGTLDAPTAMEMALRRAQTPPAPAVSAEEPAAPAPAPEPRIVPRTPDMVALPKRTAELRAEQNGGEVVRIQNRSGKFAYTVLEPARATEVTAPEPAPAPAPAAGLEGGGEAAAVQLEPDGADRQDGAQVQPDRALKFQRNKSGTLSVFGSPQEVKTRLAELGITRALPAKEGVLVPVSEAGKAERILTGLADNAPAPEAQALDKIARNTEQQSLPAFEQPVQPTANQPTAGRTSAQAADGNPFKTFLIRNGIALRLAKDFVPGTRERLSMGRTFRNGGMELDALAERAAEQGYIRSRDDTDELYSLVAKVASGERVAPMYGQDAEAEMRRLVDRQRQLEEDAAQNVGDLTDGELAYIEEVLDDVPALDAQSNVSMADAMRALGFTEQEIEDATAAPEPGIAQTDRASAGEPVEAAAGEAQGSRAGRDQAPQTGAVAQPAPEAAPADAGVSVSGDLLGDAPNASQQQAERIRRQKEERERAQRQSAPAAEGFALGMVDQRRGEEVAPGQGEIESSGPILDVGEKIGGARKDTAVSTGKARKAKTDDTRPAWARRFSIGQIAGTADPEEGRWIIHDTKNTDWTGQPRQIGSTFATKEEAEAFVPIAAVALKHRAVPVSDDAYEIWRTVSERKRVKVVDQKFASRDDAMRYMAEHAAEILETNTTFGESDLPQAPDRARTGPQRRNGNVKGDDFKDAFGFRGVEFGNWNNQDERQALMNDAYDGLMDLAEVLGVPPKALGLNGDLALAFGARGQGLNSARAHYEHERAVINLTKENGAGSLAHEWFHALDHYFGRQDGKASSEWVRNADGTRTLKAGGNDMASGGFGYKSKVRPEVREAYDALIKTMFKKATAYVEETDKADKFVAATREELAGELDRLRKELSEQKNPEYYKRNNKPASAEQLAEFDAIAKRMVEGEAQALTTDWRHIEGMKAAIASRWTNDSLEQINAIYKAVRGRSGFDSQNRNGWMDKIAGYMKRYSQRLKMLADAQAGTEKTRMVPTDFALDAKELDQGRGGDYWTSPHEMAARAFQGYVEDKLAERGGASRFLNYAPENAGILTPWGFKRPYPRGTERAAINKAFDAFVGAIETKETDSGVAIFKRTPEEDFAGPMNAWRVKVTLGDALSRLTIPYAVHDTVEDAAAETGYPVPPDVKGMYFKGRLHLIAENIDSPFVAELTLFHEANHAGLDVMYGNGSRQMDNAMRDIAAKNKNVTAAAKQWMMKFGQEDYQWRVDHGMSPEAAMRRTKVQAINEALSDLAGKNAEIKGLSKFMAVLQEVMRSLGLTRLANWLESHTDAEAMSMILKARDAVTAPARQGVAGEPQPAFERKAEESMFSRSVMTGRPLPQTWQSPDPTKLDSLIYSLQDKHVDTRRVAKAVRDSIGQIADEIDPYLQEELYHGRAAKATKDFLEKSLKPLLVDMQARGVELSDFEEYLHNRHAERRNIQVAKVNQNMPDAGSGIKTADARAYLASLPATKRRAYEALAKRVDAITKDTRKLLIDSGLEKRTTIAAWEQAYGDEYVPLMREEMEEGTRGIGQGYSVKGSSSKRAMGSNKPVADILANIALQRERAITRAEKKRIGEAVYGMVLTAPNDDFWFAVDPELQQSPAQVTATAMQLVSLGVDPADAQNIAQEPKSRYIDPRTGQVAERINPALRNRENVLAVRIDGEDKFVFFNQSDARAVRMVTALKNLDADQLGVVMGNVAKMTRYFSAISTQYNPVFGVVNLTRDVQTALLNLSSTPLKDHRADVFKHVAPALRGIYIDLRDHRSGKQPASAWANLFEEFQKEGGATGYRDMYADAGERAEAIASELRAIKQGKAMKFGKAIMGWLSDYNEAMENAVRVATYKVGKEQGLSNQQAASIAKNLTVNFNRKGQVALQAGALYAFFNASVQGSARMAQTMFDGGKLSSAGRKILAGGLLLGSMQAMLFALAGYDDDEPPQFVRERSLVIPLPGRKYVSIPMPLGFHVIPNISRITTEWAMSGFKKTPQRLADLLGVFADAFNPVGSAGLSLQTIAPTVIDPLAALAENRDWTGKPIAKKDFNAMRPTAGHTKAKDTATPWARAISYGVNLATGGTDYKPGLMSPTPDQIDYLIGQITGGVGREVSKLSQVASSTVSGEELPMHKIPLVGRFVGTTEGQSAEASRFYDNLREIGAHKVELDGLRKDRKGREMGEYMREHPQARMVQFADKIQREVSELHKRKREMVNRGAPRDQVKLVEQQITNRMRLLNERVKKFEATAG